MFFVVVVFFCFLLHISNFGAFLQCPITPHAPDDLSSPPHHHPCCFSQGPTLANSCKENGTPGIETQTFPLESSLINEPGLGQITEQDDADTQLRDQTVALSQAGAALLVVSSDTHMRAKEIRKIQSLSRIVRAAA